MFAINQFRQGVQTLVAACDPELLDTSYQEGELQLEVRANFYDGERVEEDALRQALNGCSVANLVGERTIAIALEMGLVEASTIMKIGGIPHVQVMVL